MIRTRIPRSKKRVLARATSKSKTLPAPIGGLNTRDNKGAMDILDAIVFTNLISGQNGIRSRGGSIHATSGYDGPIETAIPYNYNINRVMITASNLNLYTDDGAGTKTSLASGFINNKWAASQLGQNMLLVNGQDSPRNFDGAVITTPAFTGDLAAYGPEKMDVIHKHNNHIYMADSNNGDFFYGAVNAVAGAFTKFQLSRVSNTSGNITEIKSITQDSGDGQNDYIAFILDTGEVVTYQGSDPGDINSFAIIGKYKTPPIIGKRCAVEFAGDIFMLTKQDIIKLSDVIRATGEDGGFNLKPSKLSGAITSDYKLYKQNYGFEVKAYPVGGWLLMNIPEVSGVTPLSHQYIINLTTGAASRFEGWNAVTFGVLEDMLFFGSATTLEAADNGMDDNGVPIQIKAQQAFSALDIANLKKVSNCKLFCASEGELNIDLALAFDFTVLNPQGTESSTTDGAEWDLAEWDVAEWAGDIASVLSFVTAGVGVYVSLQITLQVMGQTFNWYASALNFDIGKAF